MKTIKIYIWIFFLTVLLIDHIKNYLKNRKSETNRTNIFSGFITSTLSNSKNPFTSNIFINHSLSFIRFSKDFTLRKAKPKTKTKVNNYGK